MRHYDFARIFSVSRSHKNNSNHSRFLSLAAGQMAIAGLMAMAIPPAPAAAFDWLNLEVNEYRVCAIRLQRAGIRPEAISAACSVALHPKELGDCVVGITRKTDITAIDALTTCRQVRRPLELSSCVVDISRRTQKPEPSAVLDNCRRSLLPVRYAQCVVGLSQRIDLTAAQAMDSCIDGSDRPKDFYPPLPGTNSPISPPSLDPTMLPAPTPR